MKRQEIVLAVSLIVACGAALCLEDRPAPVPRLTRRAATKALRPATPLAASVLPMESTAPSNDSPRVEKVIDSPHVVEKREPNFIQSAPPAAAVPSTAIDPEAREALSLVGVDPAAESYWVAAINDPALPTEERRNLIEDLNEDGLTDPEHPQAEDFPVLARRLELLDELSSEPMDQINSEAFAEARKDLVNLLAGKPAL